MPEVVLSPEEKEGVSACLHSLFALPEEETPAAATPLAKCCINCGHRHGAGAKFCGECGLVRT